MKKRPGVRATSNIFAMFDQAQIQEFKEVSLIDREREKDEADQYCQKNVMSSCFCRHST